MMFPPYAEITTQILEAKGYREDLTAKRRFEAPYARFPIPGILLFFGSVPCAVYVLTPRYPGPPWLAIGIVTAIFGFALAAIPSLLAVRAIPVSPTTGMPLDIYEQADTKTADGYLAYIYVDTDGKTYFVRPVRLAFGRGGS